MCLCLFAWFPMLNIRLRAGFLHWSWKKKMAAVPCEIYALEYFSTTGTREALQPGRIVWPNATESTPRIFGKQGKETKLDWTELLLWEDTPNARSESAEWLLFQHWNWCLYTMIWTSKPKCDATSCHVSWYQLNWAFGGFHKEQIGGKSRPDT